MVHEYEKYRLANGISPNTVIVEKELLTYFLTSLNSRYKTKVEMHEIRPADVRYFLEQEKEKGLASSTVMRKLSTLRQFFHFLWKTGKVPVDFMPKFEISLPVEERTTLLQYEVFLNEKSRVLRNDRVTLNDKLYFLFAMRGLRMREIERIRTIHFQDVGDCVEMHYETINEYFIHWTFTEPEEVMVLLQAMERALFREHDYLVSSTKKFGADYVRYNQKDIHNRLSAVLPKRFKSEEVRLAYIFYLYKTSGKTTEEVADILGVHPKSFAQSLQSVLELYKNVNYTKATH